MRKIFSLLAAVLFAGSMMATEVVFTNADFAGQGTANTGSEVTATKDGVTFTYSKGYSAEESLRCYAHGALTISAESTIEKINFTTTGGKTGGLDAEVTVGATTYSVEDLASQARFTEIKVTLGGGEAPAVATPVISGEAEFTESTQVSITCATEGAAIYFSLDGADPTTNSIPYEEPFTIEESATVKAVAYDREKNEYSAIASKTFTKKEPLVAISCAEVYNKAKNDELALNNVVVTYANGKNVYVQDATGSMLLYLTQNTTWEAGNILSGVEGTLDIYNGLYEVKMTEAQATAVQPGQGEVPAPVEFTAAPVAADMNKYIVLKNVTVSAETFPSNKNMNATIGEETFVLRNQFNADIAFDTNKAYDITGVVAVYNSTVQVYFINATEVEPAVEPAFWIIDEQTPVTAGSEYVNTEHLAVYSAYGTTLVSQNYTIDGVQFTQALQVRVDAWPTAEAPLGTEKSGSTSLVFNAKQDTKIALYYVRQCVDKGAVADDNKDLWLFDTLAITTKVQSAMFEVAEFNADSTYAVVRKGYELQAGHAYVLAAKGTTIKLLGMAYTKDEEVVPPTPVENYYVVGSMTNWSVSQDYILTPSNDGEYMGEFTFAANDEFKVVKNDKEVWYPEGMGNNYVITEAGDYKITFNPAGNVEGWYAGYYNVVKKEEPVALTIAQAIEIGMALDSMATSEAEYVVEGYVINAGAFSQLYHNQSWYMVDDAAATESSFQAYNCYPIEGNDTLKVLNGDKVSVAGKLKKYYNKSAQVYIIEIEKGDAHFISKVDGDHSTAVETETITVAQALEIGAALADGAVTEKQYKITGYVSAINVKSSDAYSDQYKNQSFWVADDANSTASTNAEGAFYVYRGKPDTEAEIPVGSKVEFTCTIKKYVPAAGGDAVIENADQNIVVKVLEAGEVDTLNVQGAVDLALALEDNAESAKAYAILGYVAKIKTAYNEQYGSISFYMTDTPSNGEEVFGDLQVYQGQISAEEGVALAAGDRVLVVGKLKNNFYNEKNSAEVVRGSSVSVMWKQAIENIVLTEKVNKVLMDGVIYIVRDGKLYNLQGAQVR